LNARKKVVEARHQQADRALQDDRERPDDKAGHRLLDDGHVEIAVEQAAGARVGEERVAGMDRAHRDLGHHAREDATLEDGEQIDPQR
jgi:hypothetical protein